ncbi:helix-turn-helix transcriptional regulator [Aerococcaceae bacterium DSM 111176]|nr:helix-turn-helix transcriptional regulator [Aerococcaceae bacterium DSM 111176]
MQERVSEILIYMKDHLHEEQSIEAIADHFGYSKYYFSRTFKQATGFAASDYLSSLKVEQAKQDLLRKQADVTHASLNAGFMSLGTFSKNFTEKTGLSPREYIKEVDRLYGVAQTLEQNTVYRGDNLAAENQLTYQIHASVHYPDEFKPAIIFVGLFNTPIPNHRPVIGVALKNNLHHTFINIPRGKYYLLTCAIEKTRNPLRFFDLSDCLRGRVEQTIVLPEDDHREFSLELRPPLPEDPPILINLPKLLTDPFKK